VHVSAIFPRLQPTVPTGHLGGLSGRLFFKSQSEEMAFQTQVLYSFPVTCQMDFETNKKGQLPYCLIFLVIVFSID